MGNDVSFRIEPLKMEDAVEWLEKELGESFVKGLGINLAKGYARVIVRTEEGEKEILKSIPRKIVNQ